MNTRLAMTVAAVFLAVLTLAVLPLVAQAQVEREGPVLTQPRIQVPTRPRIVLPPEVLGRLPRGPEVRFEAKLDPEIFERATMLRVYRLEAPRFNRGSFGPLARRLFNGELRGETTVVGGMLAQADDRSNFLMLDTRSGLMSMSRGMADQIDERPGELPGPNAAARIARNFLDENGLGPGDPKQRVLTHIGHIRSSWFNPETGEQGQPMLQMYSIYFGRVVDDVEVVGAASKMIVQIGDGGEVVGAAFNWRELGRSLVVSARDLRSDEQILADIRRFLTDELPLSERVVVDQIGLFYYDNGGQYLQPVIGFSAKVQAGEVQYSYFGQTALLNEPPELVGPAPLSEEALRTLQRGSEDLQAPRGESD